MACIKILFLALLAAVAFAYDNGEMSMEGPPRGWSTWCTEDACGLIDRCTQGEVQKRADALVSSGLSAHGYNWIFLDDCWADTERDADGNLQGDLRQFPDGMKNLADYVHARGLRLSVYTCIGTETCKKGRPGSYGYYEQDAQTFANWGVDMVKCDNCHTGGTNGTTQEKFTEFSKALNQTGHEMLFALCEWGEDEVWNWGPGVAQMYRIQMDHLPLWNYGPPAPLAAGVGYGQGVKQIIDWMAVIQPSKFSGPGQWADPDFLMTMYDVIVPTMPFVESRTEFTFWTLWSSPLLVATEIVDMSDEKKGILMNTEVLAVHEDPLWVSGERIFNATDTTQAWFRPLANGDVAVVLYYAGYENNVDDRELKGDVKEISVNFSDLGFGSDDTLFIRDLWGKQNIGQFTGSYHASVLHHDVSFVRISKYEVTQPVTSRVHA